MKKLLLLLLLLIPSILFAQVDVNRTSSVGTNSTLSSFNKQSVRDANLTAVLNLRIPIGTTYTIHNAKDSIGYVMFNTTLNRFGVYRGGGIWDTYITIADISNFQPLEDQRLSTTNTVNFKRLQIYDDPSIGVGSLYLDNGIVGTLNTNVTFNSGRYSYINGLGQTWGITDPVVSGVSGNMFQIGGYFGTSFVSRLQSVQVPTANYDVVRLQDLTAYQPIEDQRLSMTDNVTFNAMTLHGVLTGVEINIGSNVINAGNFQKLGYTGTNLLVDDGTSLAIGTFQTVTNLSTNTSLGSSNTLYPSQLAVKTYTDNAIAMGATYTAGYGMGLTAFQFRVDSTLQASKLFTARYPLKSTTVAGFDLRNNITLASLTNGYGVNAFTYNGSGAAFVVIDTANHIVDKQWANTVIPPATLARINTKVNLSGSTMIGALILNADPTSSMGAATKNYVDNIATGLYWKQPVRVATTANITLSGAQTIDGIAVIAGDRVLVKNQTTAINNGIYIVALGSWIRSTDATTGAQIIASAIYIQSGGTLTGGTQWANSNTTTPTIGTDAITYGQIAGAGVYTNGSGIDLTGNVFSLNSTYSRGLLSFTAGSGAYNSGTGQFTIPTNTNQLTNGAGFITSFTEVDPIYLASSWYSTTNNAGNWNTAFSQIRQWDGGTTGLVAATGRASLGLVIGTDVLAPNGNASALVGLNLSQITTALGYTPYNSSNPAGYISSFTETDPSVPSYAKSLSGFSIIQSSTDALYLNLSGSNANQNIIIASHSITAKLDNIKATYTDGIILTNTTPGNVSFNDQNPPSLRFHGSRYISGSVNNWDAVINIQSNGNSGEVTIGGYQGTSSTPTYTRWFGLDIGNGHLTLPGSLSVNTLSSYLGSGVDLTGKFTILNTYTNSSSVNQGLAIMPTYNQTGTASSLDLLISRTETALGSGTHLFADFRVNTISKFSVDRLGNVISTAFIKSGGTPGQFLKADGSIDNSTYVLLSGGNFTGKLGVNGSVPIGTVALAVTGDIAATGVLGGSNFSGSSSGTNTGDQTTSSSNSDITITTGSSNPVLTFNRGANFALSGNIILGGTSTFNQQINFNYGSYFNSSPDFVSGAISVRDGAGAFNLYNSGNTFATNFTYVRPTANRSITLPDASGTVALTSDIPTTGHTIFTPTTGGTVNLVNRQTNIINPAGALLALTINLPSSPTNDNVVKIKFTQTITTVTYTGGTVVDPITGPAAGGYVVLTYDSGTASWY